MTPAIAARRIFQRRRIGVDVPDPGEERLGLLRRQPDAVFLRQLHQFLPVR
jgi:hypothetical protein